MVRDTTKYFNWWWGTSARRIVKEARDLTDSELKVLYYMYDWTISKGPQHIQRRCLEREIRKRKL